MLPIGKTLQSRRRRLGLSQRSLARHLGVSPSYYCLLEQGKRRPGPEVAIRLGALLNLDWRLFYQEAALLQAGGIGQGG